MTLTIDHIECVVCGRQQWGLFVRVVDGICQFCWRTKQYPTGR